MDAGKLFGTVVCAAFILSAASAATPGRSDATTDSRLAGNGDDPPPASLQPASDRPQSAGGDGAGFAQPCCGPRWTASAEFIILDRIGTFNQTLVSTYPVKPPPLFPSELIVGQGTDRVDSGDLSQGFAGGPKIGLLRHGEDGYDLEVSFFEIDGWNNVASIASGQKITPVFVAPGNFVQTTDSPAGYMEWGYATKLYNAEINVRWDLCSRVTMLAGFRWVNLSEELQGYVLPLTATRTGPFWDNTTRNNLFGLQVGEDWKIFDRGPFSMNGLVKAGIFDNVSNETTAVSIIRKVVWESDSADQAAFLGEVDLQCKYQLAPRLLLKMGYEAIWLQGVATAPGQIPDTLSHSSLDRKKISVQATGVDNSSGVFYHGATVGLEYSF